MRGNGGVSEVASVILAGGRGERLRPLTSRRPKPGVPFAGAYRLIDFTLVNCVASGMTPVHVLTQYEAGLLEEHCRRSWGFLGRGDGSGVTTLPPVPGSSYAGTADAVYQNLELLRRGCPRAVLILSGDHVYRADYRAFVSRHAALSAAVTVLTGEVPVAQASSFGVLEIAPDGRIRRFVEKPPDPRPFARDGRSSINLGVYCFRPEFLRRALAADAAARSSAHDFGRDVLPAAIAGGFPVVSCPLRDVAPAPYWRDVGTLESYLDGHLDLLRLPGAGFSLSHLRSVGPAAFRARSPRTMWLPAGRGDAACSLVSPGARFRGARLRNCVLSPGVLVEPGAELEGCVLLPGSTVMARARLRRAIIEEGATVPEGAELGFSEREPPVSVMAESLLTLAS